jgi:enoyl-CoA hydratase
VATLDRPDVLNSFNTAMADELSELARRLDGDESVRVLVITGAGERAFCAGADIAEFGSLDSGDGFFEFCGRLSRAVEAIAALAQPVIAAVEGAAFGGGCELAMACDFRVPSESARFGLPEVKLGLMPGLGGTQRAIRMLPAAVATRLLVTGDPLTAAAAHVAGFCEPPTEKGGALAAAMALAEKLAAGAPLAIAAAKTLMREGLPLAYAEALAIEQEAGRRLFDTADGREGVAAFLAKRAATFTGE